jgi:hypothetical protein
MFQSISLEHYELYFPKEQLISENNFGVFKSPKNQPNFWKISAQGSKMGKKNI